MKIKSCANIGKYAVLTFDSLPRKFKKLKIGGKVYDAIVAYEIENSAAVESNLDFNGMDVEFLE
jgi:hypothetical protein